MSAKLVKKKQASSGPHPFISEYQSDQQARLKAFYSRMTEGRLSQDERKLRNEISHAKKSMPVTTQQTAAEPASAERLTATSSILPIYKPKIVQKDKDKDPAVKKEQKKQQKAEAKFEEKYSRASLASPQNSNNNNSYNPLSAPVQPREEQPRSRHQDKHRHHRHKKERRHKQDRSESPSASSESMSNSSSEAESDSSRSSENAKARREMDKMFGKFKSEKYKRRDQQIIQESEYDRIEKEEEFSRLKGEEEDRREEEYERSRKRRFKRQHSDIEEEDD